MRSRFLCLPTATFPALAVLFLVSGCAAVSGERDPRDPWESYNRTVYDFNDSLDKAVMKPVAKTYRKVTPNPVQLGVSNFFENIADVSTGVNSLLQGKPKDGLSDLGRFAFNSVVGIFGLFDVATPLGLEKHYEDFGQTLGVWGLQSGPYFVIPLLGPSTARDAPARLVDSQLSYWRVVDDPTIGFSLYGLDAARNRAAILDAERILDEAALDRYTFVRDAWLQRRRNMVYDGKPPKTPEDE